jgi:hypothetical protein
VAAPCVKGRKPGARYPVPGTRYFIALLVAR